MEKAVFILLVPVIICCLMRRGNGTKEEEGDRILSLPGQPPNISFSQFSGYVTVNDHHGRALFYWLTEAATSNHQERPLILWLNGGGMSSIGSGTSQEIGPFRIYENGSSLYLNKYSWNLQANILFLESPVGVGFSYSNTSSDINNPGDKRTAEDALVFLIRWMSRFPRYKHRDFFIAGENYGGHSVAQLAKAILHYNKPFSNPIINLKGFLVGNPNTDRYYDSFGRVTYWLNHALISDSTHDKMVKSCNFGAYNHSEECNNAWNYCLASELRNLNLFDIYEPTCLTNDITLSHNTNTFVRQKVAPSLHDDLTSSYDPCGLYYSEKYFNLPQVQKAMHANVTGIPYQWTDISLSILLNWTDSESSMLPTYKELIAAGLRIWVFSGDTDATLPVTATRMSINHLDLTVKTRWYPWYSGIEEIGGWTEVYDGLTFATVRGAGYQVAISRPKQAFILFESFLFGKELPRA